MKDVAFNTANLVARCTGYRFELARWGAQHEKTVAETDETAWRSICRDIAAAGFKTVEVWEAHAAPESLDERKARSRLATMEEFGLRAIGYAGSYRPETVRICDWLGIEAVNGSTRLTPREAAELARSSGVSYNAENHPEKSAAELYERIGGGTLEPGLGLCIDTGWLATQGVDVPRFVEKCFAHVRHVHVKDVIQAGGHITCRLGAGIAKLGATLALLEKRGYQGGYSWEDEPEDRNPLEIAAESRTWIEERLVRS